MRAQVKENSPVLRRTKPVKFMKSCSYCGEHIFYMLAPEDPEELASKELTRLLLYEHSCAEKNKIHKESEWDRLWDQLQTP